MGDMFGDWTADAADHLDAIAHFAEQGLIDPERVGVGGVIASNRRFGE